MAEEDDEFKEQARAGRRRTRPEEEEEDEDEERGPSPKLQGGDAAGSAAQSANLSSMTIKASKYEVCEVFSVPRVTARARARGKRGGWAADIKGGDPISQKSYDLSDHRQEAQVRELIRRDQPQLLVLSPPCTLFSVL